MARNEWPLLAVSVSHVLREHADQVWVLDHASNDDSEKGLALLSSIWGDRLKVVRIPDAPYFQAAATNLLLSIIDPAPETWIYVFDADEFLLTNGTSPLKDVLKAIAPGIDTVRYEVPNWLAPTDFDETVFQGYARIRFRAVTRNDLPPRRAKQISEIKGGALNYLVPRRRARVALTGAQ